MIEEIGMYRNRQISRNDSPAPSRRPLGNPVENPLVDARLPIPPTPLVGRARELAAVAGLLADPMVRLITLTGPGGAGKTRLAIQSATAALPAFANAVTFVDLAPFRECGAVLPAIGRALDIPDSGERSLLDRIADRVGSLRCLLVLDNFEHLIEATSVITDLIMRCPALTLLVTSREVLRVYGEHEVMIPPLQLPDDHALDHRALAESEAVRLFVDRAAAVRLGFTLDASNAADIAAICARLDGLPLAIELAAARMRHLAPRALLNRLSSSLSLLTLGSRDLPTRLQTMRNAIAWSHDLLTPDERELFQRLAVFRGGFTLAAAEQVMGDRSWGNEGGEPDSGNDASFSPHLLSTTYIPAPPFASVLDGISSLVDKSLLVALSTGQDDVRYLMLETIREFGLELLDASGRGSSARDALAHWCVELVERAVAGFTGPARTMHARQLERERANIAQALTWAEATGDAEIASRLVAALAPFWEMQGTLREGEDWVRRCLAIPGAEDSPWHGSVLRGGAAITYRRGNYVEATARANQACAIANRLNDDGLFASALLILGNVAFDRGDLSSALDHYRAATARFRHAGLHDGIADARAKEGLVLTSLDELDEATAALEESLAIGRRWNRPIWVSTSIGRLAFVDQRRGDPRAAERRIAEILPAQCELNPISGVAMLWLGATIARDLGDLRLAAARYRESLELRSRWGEPRGVAEVVSGIAELAVLTGRLDDGALLYGGLEAMRFVVGAPGYRSEQVSHNQAIATARIRLGERAFNQLHTEGMALTRDETVALAIRLADDIVEATSTHTAQEPSSAASEEHEPLTARELEVLRFAALGLSDRAIGDTLFISPRTVARHLHSVYQKFDVGSRAAATAYAHRNGILNLTSS